MTTQSSPEPSTETQDWSPAPADGAPPAAGETLDEQITRLTAERDAEVAAKAAADTSPATDRKVGDLVRFEADANGTVSRGLAFVTEVVEPYDKGAGVMSDLQYLVAPLVELGVYLDGHQLTDPT